MGLVCPCSCPCSGLRVYRATIHNSQFIIRNCQSAGLRGKPQRPVPLVALVPLVPVWRSVRQWPFALAPARAGGTAGRGGLLGGGKRVIDLPKEKKEGARRGVGPAGVSGGSSHRCRIGLIGPIGRMPDSPMTARDNQHPIPPAASVPVRVGPCLSV